MSACQHRWWFPWRGSLIHRLCDRCGRIEAFGAGRWADTGERTDERPPEEERRKSAEWWAGQRRPEGVTP